MELRPYRAADAERIVTWVHSERELRLWTANCFEQYPYPLTAEQFDSVYRPADCTRLPLTAELDGAAAGHLLLRRSEAERVWRLGFIIVDDARRGQGLGAAMVREACRLAVETLGARRLTLAVFAENPAAQRCYRAAGFRPAAEKLWPVGGELWRGIEMELEPEWLAAER